MNNSFLFRNDIQGLRALSVLAVIVFHYDSRLLPGGFIGVDAFLVISGYLITQILLVKKQEGRGIAFTLKQFYLSRFKRIIPAYFFMLVLVALVSATLLTETDFDYFRNSLRHAVIFISNQYFSGFGDYFAPGLHEQPLLHTWSLAVEMQFYLLYPLLVFLLPVSRLKQILPLVVILFLIVIEVMLRTEVDRQESYYALYSRIPEFLAGAVVALYNLDGRLDIWRAKVLWLAGLLLLIGSAWLIDGADLFPGLLSIPPVLGACLLIATNQASKYKWLSFKPLVWLGGLSYSLYLWHWPILAWIRYYTGEQVLGFNGTIVFAVATVLLATLSYYVVEQYFNKKKQSELAAEQGARTSLRRAFSLFFVLVAAFGTGKIAQIINQALVPKLSVEYLRYADPDDICHGQITGDCLQGDLGSELEVLVLGDSHGAMLNHFFDYLGNELQFKAKIITASSCVTIPGFDYQRLPDWAQKPCLSQIAEAKKWIEGADIIFIAGMWSYQVHNEEFMVALEVFLESMNHQGKSVFLLPQVIQQGANPLRVRRFEQLGLQVDVQQTNVSVIANTMLANLLDLYPNATFLELDFDKLFPHAPFFNNDLIYFDEDHLNEKGSIVYGRLVKGVLGKHLLGFAI
ncbi:acyltransferase family protein [Endozoicomonas acroporae]|uniref:acyltransferase family protein n=1 Tax=Endozoicomonas acroporae TaxID=1701104 RepID=UPI003D7B3075